METFSFLTKETLYNYILESFDGLRKEEGAEKIITVKTHLYRDEIKKAVLIYAKKYLLMPELLTVCKYVLEKGDIEQIKEGYNYNKLRLTIK